MYVVPASIQVLHRCCFNFKFLKWNLRFLLRNNKNLLFSLLAVQKRYQKGNEPFKGNYWFRPSTKNWGTAKFLCNTSKSYRFSVLWPMSDYSSQKKSELKFAFYSFFFLLWKTQSLIALTTACLLSLKKLSLLSQFGRSCKL